MTGAPTDEPQVVIFDCDGVLFDSNPANVAFYTAVLDALGEPRLTPAQQHHVHMLSSPQVMELLFGHDPARRAAATRVAAAIDYRPFFRLMVPVSGLHDTLTRLRQSYRLAMATNRGRTVPDLLQKFDLAGVFDAVVGTLDVPRPKPHPDMLLECTRRLGVETRSAVFVGDTEGDQAAAAAADMPFIAVGDRCTHPVVIQHIGELPGMLERTRVAEPAND